MDKKSENPAFFQNLLSQLDTADDSQLDQLMFSLVRRHKQLHPDWELLFMSLPADPCLRKEELDKMLPLLYHLP